MDLESKRYGVGVRDLWSWSQKVKKLWSQIVMEFKSESYVV